jgi:DNA-binding helix-hairpin-helix protein with protein kinase domain
MAVFDARGRPVRLGAELGRGGEGAVFEVAAEPGQAAKLYLSPPDRARAEKLAAMTGLATQPLLRLAAWPLATLHDGRGAVAGFVMPRITGHRPVFQVYGPKLRLAAFPTADWRFLVRVAANTARAFAVVHAAGHVVGDVNHGNLLVATDGTVRFIDTDSFQVAHGGRRWLCAVGVATHQPPEMQGVRDFSKVPRTADHDAFGLAVVIFQLLCMGRHPFSGRFTGRGEPPDIEHAIAQSRYAYSRDSARTQLVPAPDTLPVTALGSSVAGLFEAAFALDAARRGRPSAARWAEALQRLEAMLVRCAANPAHWHVPDQPCPWCVLEARGLALFPVAFASLPQAAALLWQQIEAVPVPPKLPALRPPEPAPPSPASRAARRAQWRGRAIALGSGSAVAAATWLAAPPEAMAPLLAAAAAATAGGWFLSGWRPRREAAARLRTARARWSALETAWRQTDAAKQAAALRASLAEARQAAEALPQERARRLAGIAGNSRATQRERHMQACSLARARIPGIGKSKVATLLSYGIDSAADIDAARIAAIPGFGPKTVAALIAYRKECEAGFHYDGTLSASPDSTAVDQEFGARRAKLEATLRAGLARLRALAEDSGRQRAELERQAAGLRPELAQATADARLLGW